MIGKFMLRAWRNYGISSKIPQYITNNVYQNDPHYKLYPNVQKSIT